MITFKPKGQIAAGLAVHLSLALVLTVLHVHAGQYPPWSQERAELLDDWRSRLDSAEELASGGKADQAEALYLDLLDEAARAENEGLLVARAADGLADLYRMGGRHTEAAALYRRSAVMWERLLGPRQPRLAVTLHNLGTVCLELGLAEEAERHLVRALAIFEESYGVDSPQAENSRRALSSPAIASAR
jgi:tetratricopeptide (TPR) repeat protein